MTENWFLAVGGYSLCIWIKNSVICDVKCILSKNHSSLIFRTQPSKLYVWFLILFFSIEKIFMGNSVKWIRLRFVQRELSIDFLFLVQLFLGSPSACSVPINKSELYHKEDRIKKNLNRILEINKSESYTNSTDGAKVHSISCWLQKLEFYVVEVLTMRCDHLTLF